MSIHNFKVSTRSAIGFGLIGAIVLVLGLFSLQRMKDMRKESSDVDQHWLPNIISLSNLNAVMLRVSALTMRTMLVEGETLNSTQQSLSKLIEELGALSAAYEKRIVNSDVKTAYGDLKVAQIRYLAEQRLIADFIAHGDRRRAMKVMEGPINAHAAAMTRALLTLQHINNDQAGLAADRSVSEL